MDDLFISKANFIEFRKENITNFYDFEKVVMHICRNWDVVLMESCTEPDRN